MRRCSNGDCPEPAVARVATPQLAPSVGEGMGFAIVRPASTPNAIGGLLCLDCTHHAVDLMLMQAATDPVR